MLAPTPGRRQRVIEAANALSDLAERSSRELPKTEKEILLALLLEVREGN